MPSPSPPLPATISVAIIGGNLLGCATALNLSHVAERDIARGLASPMRSTPARVTLFEARAALGGNALRAVPAPDAADPERVVEVGSARVLYPKEGSFLGDLVKTANGRDGAITVLGRVVPLPGYTGLRRGRRGAVRFRGAVESGVGGRDVARYAVWEWGDGEGGEYVLRHGGLGVLDLVRRLVDGYGIRAPFAACAVYMAREAMQIRTPLLRGRALLSPLILLAVAVLGPGYLVRRINVGLAFWVTTATLIVKYGIVVGIARGADLGFLAHLADCNRKDAATRCLTVRKLMERTLLERYARSTAADTWEKFKYDQQYATRFLAPVVRVQYGMRGVEEVNALAASLALATGDFANNDATVGYCVVEGGNARLCGALLDAAAVNLHVERRLETRVTGIMYVEGTKKYCVATATKGGDGSAERVEEGVFDGIVLCANIGAENEIKISLSHGIELEELLGECAPSAQQAESERAKSTAGSHTAVVRGKVRPGFFGFSLEADLPDRLVVNGCDMFSYVERVAAPSKMNDGRGIYLIHCSANFSAPGELLAQMFATGPEMLHFGPRPVLYNAVNPFSAEGSLDDSAAHIVLGERFVYAAATDRLARHPEMDAMSATNAASLFSAAIAWAGDEEDAAEEVPVDVDFPENSTTSN